MNIHEKSKKVCRYPDLVDVIDDGRIVEWRGIEICHRKKFMIGNNW